jgi:hypothetical protein
MIDIEDDLSRFLTGDFWIFYACTLFNTASSAAPQISTESEDAGIEPRTVTTSAMAVRLSTRLHLIHNSAKTHSHSATSHPQLGYISSTTRLHLIHNSATSHPHSAIHLIHNSATSHPQLGYISSTFYCISSISRFLFLIFLLSSEIKGQPFMVLNTHLPSML